MEVRYKGTKRRGKSVFHVHSDSKGWCHLCGEQDPTQALADIWFPKVAEHDKAVYRPPGPCYTRICARCFAFGVRFLEKGEESNGKPQIIGEDQ